LEFCDTCAFQASQIQPDSRPQSSCPPQPKEVPMAKNIDDRLIGQTLTEIRKARKISRKELANRTGLSVRNLTAFEKGEQLIPASTLWHCARILDVPVADFYDEDAASNIVHTILRIRDDEIREDLMSLAQGIELYC